MFEDPQQREQIRQMWATGERRAMMIITLRASWDAA